jgi:hypothetical protein
LAVGKNAESVEYRGSDCIGVGAAWMAESMTDDG